MATPKAQARSEPATPIIREDHSRDTLIHPSFSTFQAYVSLNYTTVRDFAYSPGNPMHYGPPPVPSVGSTPGSARNSGLFASNGLASFLGWWNPTGASPGRRLSDSAASINRDPRAASNHPPPLKFQDGPPWFEDEDLVSPVIISNKHRKHKSTLGLPVQGRRASKDGGKMTSIAENLRNQANGDLGNMAESDIGEPGGVYHTTGGGVYYVDEDEEEMDDSEGDYEESDGECEEEGSRYSRDYHFSIADPDEEMHGKAVALFDFTRENDNELALVEGQIIWVSYRHGQGWLVAEDPKTGESGLVPEEYVRLFKEIQFQNSPDDITSPETEATAHKFGTSPPHPAVQSHFSTSSKDLEPFPHPELLDSSYRLGSPPPTIQRDTPRPTNSRKDSQRSESAMEIDTNNVNNNLSRASLSPTTIDREQFAIQQRRLEDGKVLNGKEKGEQEEYQILHHKSPSMSGKASPATATGVQAGGIVSDVTSPTSPPPMIPQPTPTKDTEDGRGRPLEAR